MGQFEFGRDRNIGSKVEAELRRCTNENSIHIS